MFQKEDIIPQDINFTLSVKVEKVNNNEATITIPYDLRLSQKTVDVLRGLVQAQGLTLTNMNISAKHQEDLRDVQHVVVVEQHKAE